MVDEIIARLIDPKVAALEELLRALNSIMLKILENAAPTTSFVVLIALLSSGSASVPKYSEVSFMHTRAQYFNTYTCMRLPLEHAAPTTLFAVSIAFLSSSAQVQRSKHTFTLLKLARKHSRAHNHAHTRTHTYTSHTIVFRMLIFCSCFPFHS